MECVIIVNEADKRCSLDIAGGLKTMLAKSKAIKLHIEEITMPSLLHDNRVVKLTRNPMQFLDKLNFEHASKKLCSVILLTSYWWAKLLFLTINLQHADLAHWKSYTWLVPYRQL